MSDAPTVIDINVELESQQDPLLAIAEVMGVSAWLADEQPTMTAQERRASASERLEARC